MDERVRNFIYNDDTGQLCDFCTLSEECPKTVVCYGGPPIEPPCAGMSENFIDSHIDTEAIADYLDDLGKESEE